MKKTVELLRTHTHEGRAREAGEIIELEAGSAAWLIEIGVAKPADKAKARAATKTEETD